MIIVYRIPLQTATVKNQILRLYSANVLFREHTALHLLQMIAKRLLCLFVMAAADPVENGGVFVYRIFGVVGQRTGERVEAADGFVASSYKIREKAVTGQLRERNVEQRVLIEESLVISGVKSVQLLFTAEIQVVELFLGKAAVLCKQMHRERFELHAHRTDVAHFAFRDLGHDHVFPVLCQYFLMLQTLQSGTQRRATVIVFKGSFHGRTMMCTSLTASNSAYRKHYEGLVPSIYFAEYPKLFGTPYKMEDEKCPKQYFTQFDDIFKRLVDPHSVAAILMEPVYRARAATLFRRVSGYGTCVTSATSMVSC